MSTINENLTTLHDSLEEIRNAIAFKTNDEVECDITKYGQQIREIDTTPILSASATAYDASAAPEPASTWNMRRSAPVEEPIATWDLKTTTVNDSEPTATAVFDPQTKHLALTFGLVPGPPGQDGKPGPQGSSGKDGSRYQYIYCLTNSADAPPLNRVPHDRTDDNERPGGGWSDDPNGGTEGKEFEFVSSREKIDGQWSDWSKPTLWSHFGVQGKDGNGIEYVFCLTNDPTVIPPEPTSENVDESKIVFPLKAYKDGKTYEWFDDPLPTNNQGDICWSSVRKQKHNEDGTQSWGPYSDPVIWARHSKDGKDGGGRTVQVYTGDEDPNAVVAIPTGGEWNPETNVVTPPEGPDGRVWTEDMGKVASSMHIWQSNMPFNGAGSPMAESWSEPFRLTGDDGQPGTDGESIEFIYRLLANKDDYDSLLDFHTKGAEKGITLANTDTDVVPNKIDNYTEDEKPSWVDVTNWQPEDGKYTVCESEWTDSPQGIDGVLYLVEVVCTRKRITVEENGETIKKWGDWSMPMLWSMWGEDGTDGDGVEYIYCLTPKKDEFGEIHSNHAMLRLPTRTNYEENNWGHLYQENGFVPGEKPEDPCNIFLGNNWTDEPQDVSKEQPVEWVSIRKKRKWNESDPTPSWGDFSTPKKWAMWSTDGNSFKTAYAFTCSSLPLDQIIVNPAQLTGGSYSNPIPDDLEVTYDGKRHTIIWYDTIPSGGNSESIWMVTRSFMSGSADTDSPDSIDAYWTLPCRMSDRIGFQVEYCKGKTNPDETVDTEARPYPESLQTCFVDNNYDIEIAESVWRSKEAAKGFIWGDYIEDAVWMATSQFTNGKWSQWSVVKIKGEKGDAGENGTSVEIQGTGWIFEMCPGDEGYANFLDDAKYYDEQDPANYGKLIDNVFLACDSNADGIIDYKLYVWDEVADRYADVDMTNVDPGIGYMIKGDLWIWNGHNWYNAGPIKGNPGDPAYLYLAYCNDPAVLEIETGDSDNLRIDLTLKKGKYIGRRVDNIVRTEEFLSWANVYDWSEWIGDDGWGEEQIFLLTKRTEDIDWDNGPDISNLESAQEKDFRPAHNLGEIAKGHPSDESKWSDGPLTPTEEYPFCWVCIREATTKEFKKWKGLALYSRYTDTADHLELSEDQITVPVENDIPDTEWTGADLTAILYAGNSVASRTDVSYSYAIDDSSELISNNGNKFVWDRQFFVEHAGIQKIRIHAEFTVNGIKHEFDKFCRVFWSNLGFELSVDKTVLRKDMYDSGKLIPDGDNKEVSITASLKKWDFTNNSWNPVKNYTVFAEYTYTDPDDQLAAEEGDFVIDEAGDTDKDGFYVFNITDRHNLEKIRIFATKDQTPTGEVIAFEEVGVYANGTDGTGIEYIYFVTNDENIFDPNSDTVSKYYTPTAWYNDSTYQDTFNEYVPSNQGWTDEPTGTSEEKPYEFVSARKRKNIDGKMEWTEFSWPILWAKFGRDAGTCNFANPTSMVSFVNKKLAVDRVVDTINTMKASNSAEITKVELQQVVIDGDVENPIISGSPIRINYTSRGYCGFIFEESNLPTTTDGSSFKECILDVYVRVEATAGTFVAVKSIILQKAGGESKFSVDLNNEFFYLMVKDGKVELSQWPSLNLRAYYGTDPIDTVTKIETSVKTNSDNVHVFEQTSPSINSDGAYPLELNFAGTPVESWFNSIQNAENPESEYIEGTITVTATINGKECVTVDTFKAVKTTTEKASLVVTPIVANIASDDTKTISWQIKLPNGGELVNSAEGYSFKVNGMNYSKNSYTPTSEGECMIELYHNEILCDYEPVTVVSLTNPYLLDLNPDHEYIDTDGAGTPLNSLPLITLTLWNGSINVTSDATFKANASGCAGAFNGNVWTMSSMDAAEASVDFTATVNGASATKTFKAVKSFGKVYYKLDVPTSINADKINSFVISVQKIDNGSVSNVSSLKAEGLTMTVSERSGDISSKYDISGLIGTDGYSIPIKLFKGDELMDSETIAIVRNGTLDEEAAEQLKNTAVAEAKKNLDAATTDLTGQINAAKSNLQDFINNGDYVKAAELNAEISRLNAVDSVVTRLDGYFSGGKLNSDVSPWDTNQIMNLSIAALGSSASVPEGSIGADSVFAQYFTGCVGQFGDLIAENITASKISGFSDEVTDAVNETTLKQMSIYSGKSASDSSWYILSSGNFRLGGLNGINYNANTNQLSFGSNVTLTWSNMPSDVASTNDIPDTSNFATKDDIPTDYLTSSDVDDKINKAGFLTSSNFATTIGNDWIAATTMVAKNLIVENAGSEALGWYLKSDGTWKLGSALWFDGSQIHVGEGIGVPWASSSDNSHGTGNYEVEIDGDIWTEKGNIFTKNGNIAAYNLYGSSDMRLKTTVKDINLTVDQIADAPAFVFDWNETGKRSLGSSAQYWQEILPEGVEKNPDGYLMMQYGNISLVSLINLAREVRELKMQVASLQEELKRR